MSTKTVAHEGSDYVVLCDVLYDVADRVHWVGVALNYQPLEDASLRSFHQRSGSKPPSFDRPRRFSPVRLFTCSTMVELSVEEPAKFLRVSPETVKCEWRMAKAWLLGELTGR